MGRNWYCNVINKNHKWYNKIIIIWGILRNNIRLATEFKTEYERLHCKTAGPIITVSSKFYNCDIKKESVKLFNNITYFCFSRHWKLFLYERYNCINE